MDEKTLAQKLASMFSAAQRSPEQLATDKSYWAKNMPNLVKHFGTPSMSPDDMMAVMGSTRSVGNISGMLGTPYTTNPRPAPAPKSAPQVAEGQYFPDADTFRGRMEIQGGPLAAKPGVDRIIKTLESHGMKWEYAKNGGITAYSEVVGPNGKVFLEGKHFADNSSLKTLRDWLGY